MKVQVSFFGYSFCQRDLEQVFEAHLEESNRILASPNRPLLVLLNQGDVNRGNDSHLRFSFKLLVGYVVLLLFVRNIHQPFFVYLLDCFLHLHQTVHIQCDFKVFRITKNQFDQ